MGLEGIVGGVRAVGRGAAAVGRWAVPSTAIPSGEARDKTIDETERNYSQVSDLMLNPPQGYTREKLREILGYHLDNKYAHHYNLLKRASLIDHFQKGLGPIRTLTETTVAAGGVGGPFAGAARLLGAAGDVAGSLDYGHDTGDYLGGLMGVGFGFARMVMPFGLLNYTNYHLNRAKGRIKYEAARDFAKEFRKTAEIRQESLDTKFSPMPA